MNNLTTYGFAAIMLAIVAILVVPLPPPLLDGLLALNLLGSACVLILSVSLTDPLQFSAFAPALLAATLFRLALDVSATRSILTHGHEAGGAGSLIPAFGAFVVGGNVVVGIIMFIILVTIQFIVIASGSQRVAEVAARFTLDALPGKQMAIDADVHAGLLDTDGARHKRALVQAEADFYGAMDGAGKFVKGDAIAALVIVAINVAGGVVIGLAYHGLSVAAALDRYALLSIGNALLTTLPAFLLSTAMGMMVTRAAGEGSLGSDLARQLLARPDVLRAGGALMLALAFVPGLPAPVFGVTGLTAIAAGAAARRHARSGEAAAARSRQIERELALRRPEMALGLVGVDPVSIAFGAELHALLGPPHADRLLGRIGEIRRVLAAEIGIVLPGVRLRDDAFLPAHGYAIAIRETIVARGELRLESLVAVADEAVLATFPGEPAREPIYGLPARRIDPAAREIALAAGALVFDPIAVLGSHLAEAARGHAGDLLGRQELQTLLEFLRTRVPALIKDVCEAVPPAVLQRVFALLLRERAWPRDMVATLEAVLEAALGSRDARDLAEAARRTIVPAQLRRQGRLALAPLLLAPEFERRLSAAWIDGALAPEPALAVHLRACAQRYLSATLPLERAVVCSSALRPALAECLHKLGVALDVYSFAELPAECALRPAAFVEAPAQEAQTPVIVNA